MIKFVLACALLSVPVLAAAAERRFTVTQFDRIQVDGPFQVEIRTGGPGSAVARGSNEALDRISVEVHGQLLKIKPSQSGWGGYPGQTTGPVVISVSTHGLRSAAVNGAGRLRIDGAKAMRFDAALTGAGAIDVAGLQADIVSVALLGSGRIGLAGQARTVRATVQGTGDLDTSVLAAEDIELNAATAGNVVLSAKRSAKVTAGGTGEIRIVGTAACTVKGSGRVDCPRQ